MPTSRTFSMLAATVATAVLALAGLGLGGCAPDDGDRIGEADGELGESPRSAGITEGSPEEEGVLLLANDRAVSSQLLTSRAHVAAPIANSIVAFRTSAEGKPRWFSTIDEIDALPATEKDVFAQLVADAKANGYVDIPGFDDPNRVKLVVLPNAPHPTSNDVTVEAGFDGKSPAETVAMVRARLTNTIDSSNERFVTQTITDSHKAFTLAINNFMLLISGPAIYARQLKADRLTVLATMSAVTPTILKAEKDGVTTYHARISGGPLYGPLPAAPKYPVIMRAQIHVPNGLPDDRGPGVRVFYPAWSAKVLSAPTGTIIEGGH